METFGSALLIAIVMPCFLGAVVERCMSPQYLELGKMQEIQCHFQHGFYAIAWYDSDDFTASTSLIRVVNGVKEGNGYFSGEFDIQTDGSLVLNNVTLQHDHKFTVLTFQSQDDDPLPLVVKVVVTVAAYPVVHGCTLSQYCVLSMPFEGSLTCSVSGIRPKVQLEWRTLDARDSSLIMFSVHERTTSTDCDTYDVQITSKYRIQQTPRNRLTLECGILEPTITAFSSTAKFDLLINSIVQPTVNQPTVIQPNENDAASVTYTLLWIVVIIVTLVLSLVVACLCLIAKDQRKMKKRLTQYEIILMSTVESAD